MAFKQPGDPPDWCPGCEPDLDPLKVVVVEVRCYKHEPIVIGPDDAQATELLNKRAGYVSRVITDYSDL